MSLSERYQAAIEVITNLGNSTERQDSENFKTQLNSAISQFTELKSNVQTLALFSDNESLDELQTSYLKFMSLDYYLATLFNKKQQPGRLESLQQTVQLLVQFLLTLDDYELLEPSLSKKLTQFKKLFEPSLDELYSKDPTSKREEKIATFQKNKELKQSIEYYESRGEDVDEEELRKLYILKLQQQAFTAFGTIEGCLFEIEMLKNMPPPGQREPPKEHTRTDEYIDRVETINKPLLSKSGKVLRTFTLLNNSNKAELKKKVFGFGQYGPTMTVEEFIDQELKNGGMVAPDAPEAEIDEDNEAWADEQTYKAREWDDFTESHAKGSGNTINRG